MEEDEDLLLPTAIIVTLQTPTPVCFNKQSPIDIHVYLTRIRQKRQCTLKCEGLLICLSKYLKNRDKYCLCWGLNQCPLACKSITVCTLPIELKIESIHQPKLERASYATCGDKCIKSDILNDYVVVLIFLRLYLHLYMPFFLSSNRCLVILNRVDKGRGEYRIIPSSEPIN